MEQVRIAVIGAGAIGRTHVEAIRRSPVATLAAIVDPAPGAAALAAAAGCPHLAGLDALAALAPDGAIVATPNALHVPQALALIEAGIPVLVEKPLAETAAACDRLIAAAEARRVPGLVGHHRRHNPIVQAARAAVTSGAFGTLVAGTILAVVMKPASYFAVDWRRQPGSGGPILINLIHEIDLVRHLFGEIAAVSALAAHAQRGLGVEDTAAVLLRLADGGIVTVTLTDAGTGPWAWDTTAGENPDRFPAMAAPSHLFAGSRAGLSLPDLALWTHDGAPDWTRPQSARTLPAGAGDSYDAQIAHFAAVIRGTAAPLVTLRDGARNLAVIEAIRASIVAHETVAVALPAMDTPPERARAME